MSSVFHDAVMSSIAEGFNPMNQAVKQLVQLQVQNGDTALKSDKRELMLKLASDIVTLKDKGANDNVLESFQRMLDDLASSN